MTHKEFAARWRASRRTRAVLLAVALFPVLATLGILLYGLESDGFIRVLDHDSWQHKALRLAPGLILIFGPLVIVAFIFALKHVQRRHGFVCPGCKQVFLPFHIQTILSGGHCCFCGERVLEEDPPRS